MLRSLSTLSFLAYVIAVVNAKALTRTAKNRPERRIRGWSSDAASVVNSGSSKKGGKGKGGSSPTVSFCNNCVFTVNTNDVAGFQVVNGLIQQSNQIMPADALDNIQICDNCKCSGTNTDATVVALEAECDLFMGIDVLEFTVTAYNEQGTLGIVCPDATFLASADCDTFAMTDDGAPRIATNPTNAGIFSKVAEGPTVTLEILAQHYADCTVVCTNPNPPPEPIPSKSRKGKGKSGNREGVGGPRDDISSKEKREILRYYDPFDNRFPS